MAVSACDIEVAGGGLAEVFIEAVLDSNKKKAWKGLSLINKIGLYLPLVEIPPGEPT